MKIFNQLPEFQKEFKRLENKYPSLSSDLIRFKDLINDFPTGMGKNFSIIHSREEVKIIKARLACKSLKDRSIRLICAYHKDKIEFMYIELYFKGEKENEDRERIKRYLEGGV